MKYPTDVYNPFSMLNAMKSKEMNDYWFKSGTPTYLLRLLAHSDENMNEITGKYYAPKEFIDYKATVEQPLPMIYQSGYLTIKDFDIRRNKFLLDYPNNEVRKGFLSLVAGNSKVTCQLVIYFLITIPFSILHTNLRGPNANIWYFLSIIFCRDLSCRYGSDTLEA